MHISNLDTGAGVFVPDRGSKCDVTEETKFPVPIILGTLEGVVELNSTISAESSTPPTETLSSSKASTVQAQSSHEVVSDQMTCSRYDLSYRKPVTHISMCNVEREVYVV